MNRAKIFRLLYVLLLLAAPLDAQQKKTITPGDIVGLQLVRDVQISPDGKTITYAAGKRSDFDQLRESKIWLVPSDGSTAPRMLPGNAIEQSSPRWSPDGSSIAFLANRESESAGTKQIWLHRIDSAESSPITDLKSGVNLIQWSPDGNSIAFLATDPMTEEEERAAKEKNDAVAVNKNHKLSRLYSLSIADHSIRKVFAQDVNVNDFDWSPDGSMLALKVSDTPLLDDVYYRCKLIIIDFKTGQIARTLEDHAGYIGIRWSPDGKSIVYAKASPNGVAEWKMLGSPTGDGARQIDDEYAGTILGMEWMPDSKSLLAVTIEGTRMKFVRIDATATSFQPLAEFQAPYADYSLSADGSIVAFVGEQQDSPANVWLWKSGETPRRVTNLQPEVATWDTGSVREITWKNKNDNMQVFGLLITPPRFQEGKSYPAVVQVHGGPEWAWWSGWHGSWHEWAQLLASNGYVVFLPNPRGSDGKNWRFIEANIEDWGGQDYEDILSGLDLLIQQKVIDPDRVGIGGWSYGGFMTSWAITHTDRFKAAVVGAAVTNLFTMYTTGDIPTFLEHYFKGTPFERRAIFDAHSPMSFLKDCKTPALVLHGEADLRVPISQGFEFYNGLRLLDRTAEMVSYPRETHGFKEATHQQDLLQRILDWYNTHLDRQ